MKFALLRTDTDMVSIRALLFAMIGLFVGMGLAAYAVGKDMDRNGALTQQSQQQPGVASMPQDPYLDPSATEQGYQGDATQTVDPYAQDSQQYGDATVPAQDPAATAGVDPATGQDQAAASGTVGQPPTTGQDSSQTDNGWSDPDLRTLR